MYLNLQFEWDTKTKNGQPFSSLPFIHLGLFKNANSMSSLAKFDLFSKTERSFSIHSVVGGIGTFIFVSFDMLLDPSLHKVDFFFSFFA